VTTTNQSISNHQPALSRAGNAEKISSDGMIETHKSIMLGEDYRVTACQFDRTKPIPQWVFRTFHQCGGDGPSENWSGFAVNGELVEAKPTDWAVHLGSDVVVVLTDEEFKKSFEVLPEVAK
jgi:hypothetical protein